MILTFYQVLMAIVWDSIDAEHEVLLAGTVDNSLLLYFYIVYDMNVCIFFIVNF